MEGRAGPIRTSVACKKEMETCQGTRVKGKREPHSGKKEAPERGVDRNIQSKRSRRDLEAAAKELDRSPGKA